MAARALPAIGLALLTALPLGLAATQEAPEPAMDVPTWLALAGAGQLPTDCEVQTLDLPAASPLLLAAETRAVTPAESCTGIRPGARFSNIGCTMNFVFTDGASLYVGTAGHCTSSIGQRFSTAATGAFGSVVQRLNGGIGNDFALIKVDAAQVGAVNPKMCVWGGPEGAATAGNAGSALFEYGWGFVTSSNPITRARPQVSQGWAGGQAAFSGFGSPGDSGAPVIDQDGNAWGVLTHGTTQFGSVPLWGTNIQRALSLARGAGYDVTVVSAPFLP